MVVTPQTYGKNRDSNDVRLRWLAKSIDLLLQRYPKCFKAAYLEKAEVDGMGLTEYSVCIRVSRGSHQEGAPLASRF
jgi:1,3-beta-glucan synthase